MLTCSDQGKSSFDHCDFDPGVRMSTESLASRNVGSGLYSGALVSRGISGVGASGGSGELSSFPRPPDRCFTISLKAALFGVPRFLRRSTL